MAHSRVPAIARRVPSIEYNSRVDCFFRWPGLVFGRKPEDADSRLHFGGLTSAEGAVCARTLISAENLPLPGSLGPSFFPPSNTSEQKLKSKHPSPACHRFSLSLSLPLLLSPLLPPWAFFLSLTLIGGDQDAKTPKSEWRPPHGEKHPGLDEREDARVANAAHLQQLLQWYQDPTDCAIVVVVVVVVVVAVGVVNICRRCGTGEGREGSWDASWVRGGAGLADLAKKKNITRRVWCPPAHSKTSCTRVRRI